MGENGRRRRATQQTPPIGFSHTSSQPFPQSMSTLSRRVLSFSRPTSNTSTSLSTTNDLDDSQRDFANSPRASLRSLTTMWRRSASSTESNSGASTPRASSLSAAITLETLIENMEKRNELVSALLATGETDSVSHVRFVAYAQQYERELDVKKRKQKGAAICQMFLSPNAPCRLAAHLTDGVKYQAADISKIKQTILVNLLNLPKVKHAVLEEALL